MTEVTKARRRGFIHFQRKAGRPPLSREQFLYLMDHLPKVLKVGTEFEINLPSPETVLEAKDDQPCVHSEKPCVKDCANLETCMTERHPAFCLTRSTGKFLGQKFECPAKNDADVEACQHCPAWMLNCRGLNCALHTPFCTICPSFQRAGETPEKGDIRADAETVRREMKELLQPTGFVGNTGKSGVLEVKKDNSLINNGGIEVPTVGRRVHWASFYRMCQNIIDPIVERGGFVNERCGQHYHVLAGYFKGRNIGQSISELEEPLPEIVLANLHQLHRRYELAMFWIMSAGTEPEHLTRWARFRQSIGKFSALQSKMPKVQEELAQSIVCMGGTPQNGKYASVAYHFCEFDRQGDLQTFHIENRIADGALSPAVVAAWGMLTYALVLKAVRLSQYGIMEIGDQEYRQRIKEIQPHLVEGGLREWGSDRKADTQGLAPYYGWLRDNAREMVNFLKPELHNLGPAYDILMSLADRPCSLRLIDGDDWARIESDLMSEHQAGDEEQEAGDEEIQEIVDLAGIVDCDNIEMWIEEVAAYLGQEPPEIADTVYRMIGSGRYRWSDPIGAVITTS